MSGMCINFGVCESCKVLHTCWILPTWLYEKYGREKAAADISKDET